MLSEINQNRAQIAHFDADIIENRAKCYENTHNWGQHGGLHVPPIDKIWGGGMSPITRDLRLSQKWDFLMYFYISVATLGLQAPSVRTTWDHQSHRQMKVKWQRQAGNLEINWTKNKFGHGHILAIMLLSYQIKTGVLIPPCVISIGWSKRNQRRLIQE